MNIPFLTKWRKDRRDRVEAQKIKEIAEQNGERQIRAYATLCQAFETLFATSDDALYEILRSRPLEDGSQKLVLVLPGKARCSIPDVGGTANFLVGKGALYVNKVGTTYQPGSRFPLRLGALTVVHTSTPTLVIVDTLRVVDAAPAKTPELLEM